MSWSCDCQLCFNTSKCKVMHISRKNIERTYKLASVDRILDLAEVVNEFYLGMNFLCNLQFDKHIANICAKAIVGIIKHQFSLININMFQIFLRSLV